MSSNKNSLLENVLQKYQISPTMARRLKSLEDYKIALILDDSSSMNIIDSAEKNTSRWEELSNFAKVIIEIASVFNTDGCDVFFLNMQPVRKVRSIDRLAPYFREKPAGATPLSRTLKNVIKENPVESLDIKNLLIIIATDGEPTDIQGYSNIPEFKKTLIDRPSYVFTNIVACTDDERSIGYLNGLDRELPRLDVVDDYASELAEIRRLRGLNYNFSFGDYVTKAMLGSINPDLDRHDEIKPTAIQVPVPVVKPVSIPEPPKKKPQQTAQIKVPQISQAKKRRGCTRFYLKGPELDLIDLLCCSS